MLCQIMHNLATLPMNNIKGPKLAQTSLAVQQFHARCILISFSYKHIEHFFSAITRLLYRFAWVGIELMQTLQIKFLTLSGTKRVHLFVHLLFFLVERAHLLFHFDSSAAKYAVLIVNLSCSVKAHINLSSCLVISKGMLRMVLLSSSQEIS